MWSRRQHFLVLCYYAQELHYDYFVIEGNERLESMIISTHFYAAANVAHGY